MASSFLLWTLCAALALAVAAVIARPLWRTPASQDGREADRNVYRDQLAEIDRDLERGLIAPDEAAAARIEVSRRILSTSEAASDARARTATGQTGRSLAPWGAVAAIPLAAMILYAVVGSPDLPDQPRSGRVADAHGGATIQELMARVEARLREAPEDGRGWDVIAPVYLNLGRNQEAREAFANALRLLGDSPGRLAGFAEATVALNDGRVTPDAVEAYQKLRKLSPDRVEPRYWLALAREQSGDLKGANAEYAALLAEAPADAPWRQVVADRLTAVGGDPDKIPPKPGSAPPQLAPIIGSPAPTSAAPASPTQSPPVSGAPGPTAEDVAAASQMSEGDRNEMIRGMVARLAARLAEDGTDVQGWQRLLRAYTVLGDRAEATAALERARKALEKDQAAVAEIERFARELGIGS